MMMRKLNALEKRARKEKDNRVRMRMTAVIIVLKFGIDIQTTAALLNYSGTWVRK